MVWLAQCVGFASVVVIIIPSLNIIFGSCWLFIVIAEDITNDLITFNIKIKKAPRYSDCAELVESLCVVIRLYSDAKR